MTTRKSLSALVFGVGLAAMASAHADGRLLASECAQCHGTNGSGGFEALAGRSASSLYGDLRDMKYRPVENIMDRQARAYTDQQLWEIAQYFASLPPVAGGY